MEGKRERHALQQLQQEHQESRQRRAENVQAISAGLLEEVTACNITRHLYTDVIRWPDRCVRLRGRTQEQAASTRWLGPRQLDTLDLIFILGRLHKGEPTSALYRDPT
jgi:hypothetical protein